MAVASTQRSWRSILMSLVHFSRPHTIIATSLQVFTMWLIIVGPAWNQPAAPLILGLTWIACLALNIFVVGINQVVDVAIDRINKPYLPLAAKTMTPTTAMIINTIAALVGLAVALATGPYLLLTVLVIMAIGAGYSIPPLRLKRVPLAAAVSIAFARGFLANVGLALHYAQRLDRPLPIAVTIAVGIFFFGFGLVIALYKDLPDACGDRAGRIETFTTRLGSVRVLGIGRLILTLCYSVPIALAIWNMPEGSAIYLLLSHALLIGLFWFASLRVDFLSTRSLTHLYTLLWGLFYSEFLVLAMYAVTRSVL
ncbi:MAG: homogentisate phytyltransferase [Oscillochloris sp.]|nr:homogentisate phytyltransferase [Oscillochloris sp.]